MCKTIPTYYLYGLEAIPAEVIGQGDGVRVVERGIGRTLRYVKQESDSCIQAGVQSGRPTFVRREPVPETMSTCNIPYSMHMIQFDISSTAIS